MTEGAKAFRRDIIKLVLDKLLIGGVILGLGLLGSHWIEKFKNREAFVSELNKNRVEKISEIWEKLYVYEPSLQSTINTLDSPPTRDPDLSDEEWEMQVKQYYGRASEEQKKLGTIGEEIHSSIEAKRFWLNDEEYNNIRNYLEAAKEFVSAKSAHPPNAETIQKAQAKRDKLRATITSTRQKLLNE
jgi:hypothetical protein